MKKMVKADELDIKLQEKKYVIKENGGSLA